MRRGPGLIIAAWLAAAGPALADGASGGPLGGLYGVFLFLIIAITILVRYPAAARALGALVGWLWRQGQGAIERSQTPGEELSAPPTRDPRLGPDPAAPPAPSPAPASIPASSIIEEVGKRPKDYPPSGGGIVSDVGGWSPFRNRK